MHIRQFIREVLKEDYESWVTAAQTSGLAYIDIQTADMPNKDRARAPRDVKRMWNQHADHSFFDTLVKVHWLSGYLIDYQQKSPTKMIKSIVKGSGKDEISTMGYLPGSRLYTTWGDYGILIQGRTTLAANDMDSLMTGEHPGNYAPARKKWKSSGLPRRPASFQPYMASQYILDRDSFDELETDHNELVVDNWKAVGFVIPGKGLRQRLVDKMTEAAMKKFKLPVYDYNMNRVEL